MDELEREQREAVVKEALSWLKTPYHHMGRVKGVGVDCGMLIAEVFEGAGLIPKLDIGYYPLDWHLHRSEERYMGWVRRYAAEVSRPPLPGDVILYQWGRCMSHGAIVVEWPLLVHAYIRQGVVLTSGDKDPLSGRQQAVFSFWR
mgnify:CR=1 FL=1